MSGKWYVSLAIQVPTIGQKSNLSQTRESRGDRGWLSHGLVVTLLISYSLDGGTLLGFTRDMPRAD